jgi:hypothetical protein
MYQLDMLKGKQMVEESLSGVLITGVAFIAPFVLAFVISIGYFHNKGAIKAYNEKIAGYQSQVDEMEEIKQRVDRVVSENKKLSNWLGDVGEVLLRHTQWTDVLLAVSDNLPGSLIVDKLDIKHKTVNKTVAERYGNKKKIKISVPSRTLVVSLYSRSDDGGDAAVRDLQKNLTQNEAFRNKVKDVVISLREPDVLEGDNIVRYQLNCIMNDN